MKSFSFECIIDDVGREEWLYSDEWKSTDDAEYARRMSWFYGGYEIDTVGTIFIYFTLSRKYGPRAIYDDGSELYYE